MVAEMQTISPNKNAKTIKGIQRRKSILYVQFTNPTAYPPLEHSASILSALEWEVFFAGIRWNDSSDFSFSDTQCASLKLITAPKKKWARKLFYGMYIAYAVKCCIQIQPSWVYVSDPVATPAGLILCTLGFKVIYHEHDSPSIVSRTLFERIVMACRNQLAKTCSFNVIPQETRKLFFHNETRTKRPVVRVWNCPRRDEVSQYNREQRTDDEPLGIYYHGSISLQRVPLQLIEAAGRSGCPVLLRIVGYETIGSRGATIQLRQAASAYSNTLKLEAPGPQSDRHDLFIQMKAMHLGWVAFNEDVDDRNLRHLAGASNKAFDYLAVGLALFMNNSPEWVEIFGTEKTGIPCDISDVDQLSDLIKWAYHNPQEVCEMGRRGRELVLSRLNYTKQFDPVLQLMQQIEST